MVDRVVLQLWEPVQAFKAINFAWKHAKNALMAGHRLTLEVGPEKQEPRHVKHYHALINEISEQLGGDLANKDDAKRILLSAFKIDTQAEPDLSREWARFEEMRMGRGLRGEVVILGNQTRNFTKPLAKAFILWLEVFGAENGVEFKPWGDAQ